MIVKKLYKKIALLLAAILVVTLLWFSGLNKLYAHVLTFTTNSLLSIAGRVSNIQITEQEGSSVFIVHTVLDGQQATYPLAYETLLLPTIMMLSWVAFTPWFRKRAAAIRSSLIVFLLFLTYQVVFFLLLTAYYTSATASFFYDVMQDGFYIVALGIFFIDNLTDPVFSINQGKA